MFRCGNKTSWTLRFWLRWILRARAVGTVISWSLTSYRHPIHVEVVPSRVFELVNAYGYSSQG